MFSIVLGSVVGTGGIENGNELPDGREKRVMRRTWRKGEGVVVLDDIELPISEGKEVVADVSVVDSLEGSPDCLEISVGEKFCFDLGVEKSESVDSPGFGKDGFERDSEIPQNRQLQLVEDSPVGMVGGSSCDEFTVAKGGKR